MSASVHFEFFVFPSLFLFSILLLLRSAVQVLWNRLWSLLIHRPKDSLS